MVIRVELSPETQARLSAEAQSQGVPAEKLAERLLRDALADYVRPRLSVEEFHQMLGAMAEGSENLPDLPTERFSRESFYRDGLNGGDAVPHR